MSSQVVKRRSFLAAASAGSLWAVASSGTSSLASIFTKSASKLAVLGGQPVRDKPFPSWPVWDDTDEQAVIPVLQSGRWSRQSVTQRGGEEVCRTDGCQTVPAHFQRHASPDYLAALGGGWRRR